MKYKDLKIVITRMTGVKIEEVLVTREIGAGEAKKTDPTSALESN